MCMSRFKTYPISFIVYPFPALPRKHRFQSGAFFCFFHCITPCFPEQGETYRELVILTIFCLPVAFFSRILVHNCSYFHCFSIKLPEISKNYAGFEFNSIIDFRVEKVFVLYYNVCENRDILPAFVDCAEAFFVQFIHISPVPVQPCRTLQWICLP